MEIDITDLDKDICYTYTLKVLNAITRNYIQLPKIEGKMGILVRAVNVVRLAELLLV
jgi:hypothetical protein